MVSFSDRIPKKSCKEAKHCALCKNHGGVQNTYNTGDCKKYNSDGTPKKGFAGMNVQHPSRNKRASHEQNASYAQLSTKIVKLEKSNKKLKHVKKSVSASKSVIATTRTHLDVMDPVAMGI